MILAVNRNNKRVKFHAEQPRACISTFRKFPMSKVKLNGRAEMVKINKHTHLEEGDNILLRFSSFRLFNVQFKIWNDGGSLDES